MIGCFRYWRHMGRNCPRQRLTPCGLWPKPSPGPFSQSFFRTHSCLLLTDAPAADKHGCDRNYVGHRIKNPNILVKCSSCRPGT